MYDFLDYFGSVGSLQIVGLAVFLVCIGAFGAVPFGRLDGNGTTYSVCNVLAASLVGISLLEEFNLS